MITTLLRGPVALAGTAARTVLELGQQATATLAETAEALRALPRLTVAIERLVEAVPDLRPLARLADEVIALADSEPVRAQVTSALQSLQRIAAATDALGRLAGATAALEQLAEAAEHVEELARHAAQLPLLVEAAGALPELPANISQLRDTVGATISRLSAVEPDLRALAGSMTILDASIKVLATAVAPLQGTSERLGRLVDRLPDRRRREPQPDS